MSTQSISSSNSTKEKLVSDIRVVAADAEELIKATAGHAGERVIAAREKAQESLMQAKNQIEHAGEVFMEKTKVATKMADDYVHGSPWQAIGIAAGAGLLVGLLLSRR